MTNQIKYLLAPLALSVLVGCGEPEANTSGTDEPKSLTGEAELNHVMAGAANGMAAREAILNERAELYEDACIAAREAGPGNVAAALSDNGVSEEFAEGWAEDEEKAHKQLMKWSVEECAKTFALVSFAYPKS